MTRFVEPISGDEVRSEYDIESDLIGDEELRNVSPIETRTFALNPPQDILINAAGRGFVCFFWNGTKNQQFPVNDSFVNVYINKDYKDGIPYPAKYGRGFRGTFSKLLISNPQSQTAFCTVIIFKSRFDPWMFNGSQV